MCFAAPERGSRCSAVQIFSSRPIIYRGCGRAPPPDNRIHCKVQEPTACSTPPDKSGKASPVVSLGSPCGVLGSPVSCLSPGGLLLISCWSSGGLLNKPTLSHSGLLAVALVVVVVVVRVVPGGLRGRGRRGRHGRCCGGISLFGDLRWLKN